MEFYLAVYGKVSVHEIWHKATIKTTTRTTLKTNTKITNIEDCTELERHGHRGICMHVAALESPISARVAWRDHNSHMHARVYVEHLLVWSFAIGVVFNLVHFSCCRHLKILAFCLCVCVCTFVFEGRGTRTFAEFA